MIINTCIWFQWLSERHKRAPPAGREEGSSEHADAERPPEEQKKKHPRRRDHTDSIYVLVWGLFLLLNTDLWLVTPDFLVLLPWTPNFATLVPKPGSRKPARRPLDSLLTFTNWCHRFPLQHDISPHLTFCLSVHVDLYWTHLSKKQESGNASLTCHVTNQIFSYFGQIRSLKDVHAKNNNYNENYCILTSTPTNDKVQCIIIHAAVKLLSATRLLKLFEVRWILIGCFYCYLAGKFIPIILFICILDVKRKLKLILMILLLCH